MKTYLCLLSGAWTLLAAGCVGAPPAFAEPEVPVAYGPPGPPPPPPVAAETAATPPAATASAVAQSGAIEAGSLDELVAPIALYPDALIALILPAATVSSDIVLAARYLNSGGDPNEVDSRSWDDSVKGLAHYPDVIKWMDENLAWTQRLGEAYLNQPQEVMSAVQRDRSRAQANGVLTNTPQQQVVVEDNTIRIIPAQPDVIYVPRYDPEIVYVERPVYVSSDPWLTFGLGFGVGSWLAYDCDWRGRTIWIDSHRRSHWREHRDWRHPHFNNRPGFAHEPGWRKWTPPPGRRPPHFSHSNRPHRDVVRPTPMPGAPRYHRGDRDGRRERTSDADGSRQFRPGARVPRPVERERTGPRSGNPERFTGQRRYERSPVAAPAATPIAPAPTPAAVERSREPRDPRPRGDEQARHQRRTFAPGNRPGLASPQVPRSPAPVAAVQSPPMSQRPNRDFSGHRAPDQNAGRRFAPAQGQARVAPAPVARMAPPTANPRPPAMQRPAAAPAATPRPAPQVVQQQRQPEASAGSRPPRMERQERDGGRNSRRQDP